MTIPRHNPIKGMTMGGIVRDAGLSIDEFRKLLSSQQEHVGRAAAVAP
jgi:hypothetical protein